MNLLIKESPGLFIVCLVLIFNSISIAVSIIGLLLLSLLLFFYRFPSQNLHTEEHLYSPAYGTIKSIGKNYVSIFLSQLDVHVQYAPINGKIMKQKYYQGTF